ncbi:MAG: tetratricopeptide repeat protein [Elusimicrobia bacterium]|nr:tetratricopeptide repeat protein [Elusimicrobiota bacterium]
MNAISDTRFISLFHGLRIACPRAAVAARANCVSLVFAVWGLSIVFPQKLLASTKASYMHYVHGLLLERQGSYADALAEYRAALSLDPRSSYVYSQALELAMRVGQTEQALKWAKDLVELEPKDPRSYVLLGNVQWAHGDLEKAKTSFQKALSMDPKNSQALFHLANLLGNVRPQEALKYLKTFQELNPESGPEILYQMALLEHRQGNIKASLRHLKAAIQEQPDFLQARYSLAQLYELLEDTRAALGEYKAILPLDPKNVVLLNRLGEMMFLQNREAEAETYFLKTREVDPKNSTACLWLSLISEKKGDWSQAVEYLSQSSALKEEPALHLRLSYYMTQVGRFREALNVLESAHQLWPKNDEISYFLALGYDDLKQTNRSIAILSELTKKKQEFPGARHQLAMFLEKTNRMQEAEEHFRLLLEKNPQDAMVLNYLGYALADRGLKLAEAEKFIREAVRLSPDNGAYQDSLGWVHFKQGKVRDGLKELKTALQQMGDDETIWEHLGDVYQVLGDTPTAWMCWKISYAMDSSHKSVRDKLKTAEKQIPEEKMRSLFLKYLEYTQDHLESLSALGHLKTTVQGQSFESPCLISFKSSSELKVELLGPMLVPVGSFRLLDRGPVSQGDPSRFSVLPKFEMDSFSLPGISSAALQATSEEALQMLWGYWGGEVFRGRVLGLHRGWTRGWIETKEYQLFLGDESIRLEGLKKMDPKTNFRLNLSDFSRVNGRIFPVQYVLKGPGFFAELELSRWATKFKGGGLELP